MSNVLTNIPIWVYALFILLIYIGIKRCYTRVIKLNRLLIVPAIFLIIGFKGIFNLLPFDKVVLLYMILGLVIGIAIGYFQVRNRLIKADKNHQLIQIPGDISMLIMLLAIFGIEFFIHYAVDANLQIADTSGFRFFVEIARGIIVGISIGKNSTYFYKYLHADSENLET